MTDNCNADLLNTARANVADRNMPAHRRSIMAGDWDDYSLVQAEVERLLKQPPATEGLEHG